MAEITTIARPYAEAVFDLAHQTGTLAQWSDILETLATVVEHPEVRAIIGNPKVSAEQLYGIVMAGVNREIPAEAQNLVRVLISNDRLTVLPVLRRLYEERKNEYEGVTEAEIVSAFPMADGELAELVSDLERRFKRKIEPRVTVDQELIGGARIVVGDEVIDGSVRAKLQDMALALKS
jgi:F-type H+-transporting ATPase subunit delta